MPDGLTPRGIAGGVAQRPRCRPVTRPPLAGACRTRWVVVRLLHGAITVRSWVLEGRPRRSATTWPAGPSPGPPDPSAHDVGVRAAHRRPARQLTAVAGGDPAWAANLRRRPGQVRIPRRPVRPRPGRRAEPAELSYLVAGWWSDPALERATTGLTSLGDYHARPRLAAVAGPRIRGACSTTRASRAVVPRPACPARLGVSGGRASADWSTGTKRQRRRPRSSATRGAAPAAGPGGRRRGTHRRGLRE